MPIPFRSRYRLRLLLPAIHLLAGHADSSAAGGPQVGLEYSAPGECPSTAQVVGLFQQWSPSVKLVTSDAEQHVVRLRVTLTDQGFAGVLESGGTGDPVEKREALAAVCRETVETLVFAAALSLDPIVGYQRTVTQHQIEATALRPAPTPDRDTTGSDVGRWRMGAGVNGGAGLALGSALGMSLFVERTLGRLALPPSLRLRVLIWSGRSAPSPDPSVRIQGFSGETTGCWPILKTTTVQILPCGGVQIGTLAVEGRGVPMPLGSTRTWAAGVAEARLQAWPWSSFGFEANIGTTVGIANYRFVVTKGADAVVVHSAPRWAPQVGAGFIWNFP